MNVESEIEAHLSSLPDPKRADVQTLHEHILSALPGIKLWFDDGKDSQGQTVTNPTIGYGFQILKYADGKTKEFFQIGLSANKTGISVYILGLKDKAFLAKTYGAALGKASVTGYCIKFNKLKDIRIEVLEAAIRYGVAETGEN
ncbi:MAG: DUF1801 domain-containing protein [Bacteroidota bacterium]